MSYLIGVTEAAKFLGKSKKFVKKLIFTGQIPARQLNSKMTVGRNDYLILREDLEKWFESLKKVKTIEV